MADFRITGVDAIKETMDKYTSLSAEYFSLKEDQDIAKVRFAHGDDQDLDIYVVHKVKLNGKERLIACLAPIDQMCPLCQAGHRAGVRIILSILDTRDNKMKIWDRGKTEIPNILGLVGRYGALNSRYYEIQRHGKRGDKETKYQFFPMDPIENASPIERTPVLAPDGYILQKTEAELTALMPQITEATNTFGQQQGGATPAVAQQGVGKMF